jgi:hypothetical protein
MYFDAIFKGSQQYITLQTGPTVPATHWYQTRLLLKEPLAVNRGQLVNGYLKMRANREQTFDVSLKVDIPILNVSTLLDIAQLFLRLNILRANFHSFFL